MSEAELFAWMHLNRLFPGGSREIREAIEEGMAAGEILERAAAKRRAKKTDADLRSFDPARERDECARRGIRILTQRDGAYPSRLLTIPDPPLVLYAAGEILDGDRAAAAVVGSRHASPYGLQHARRFAAALAERGLTVVSGLARGIDQAAHAGALEVSWGRTIAVLGCGLDQVYPKDAEKFYETIPARGAILSEYPLGTPPLAYHFPLRNRIISGLSLAVLVMEAHERSGSLITAREALEQGREVFALPGPVGQLGTGGTNRLIKEGAYLLDDVDEVLEVLAPELERLALAAGAGGEEKGSGSSPSESGPVDPVLGALAGGEYDADELAGRAGLGGDVLARRLTELELRGLVTRGMDGRYRAAARL